MRESDCAMRNTRVLNFHVGENFVRSSGTCATRGLKWTLHVTLVAHNILETKGALETRAPRSREAAERVVIGRGSHQLISHLQSRT